MMMVMMMMMNYEQIIKLNLHEAIKAEAAAVA
jgi:hypothetical protein